jgi:tight adherence protein B
MRALADAADSSAQIRRRVTIGSASARQSSRILLALPAITLAGAESSGVHAVWVLAASPIGWVCMAVSTFLTVAAWWWMRRIRRSIPEPQDEMGLVVLLAAEVSRTSALARERIELLSELATTWNRFTEMDVVARAQQLSKEYGVPVADILRLESARLVSESELAVEESLELLPGKLVLPVGLCLFPVFVLTTVLPVVISMVTGMVR